MSHRSFPPSHYNPLPFPPGVFRVSRPNPPATVAPLTIPISDNPRVRVFPSPNGTVTLSGVTMDGRWVAEYRCLREDFDARCVIAMERRVMVKERENGQPRSLELVRRT